MTAKIVEWEGEKFANLSSTEQEAYLQDLEGEERRAGRLMQRLAVERSKLAERSETEDIEPAFNRISAYILQIRGFASQVARRRQLLQSG
jgi:hypothetical protein